MKCFSLILSCAISVLLSVSSLLGQDRGIRFSIQDSSGKQVGWFEGSYALVIGVSDYTAGWPKLPGITDEAKQIEDALKENGFFVQRVMDPNDEILEGAFKNFINEYGYDALLHKSFRLSACLRWARVPA